jgi:hypothetical protein
MNRVPRGSPSSVTSSEAASSGAVGHPGAMHADLGLKRVRGVRESLR